MIAGKAIGVARRGTQPSTYQGKSGIPAVVALYVVLVLIAAARNGKLPDQRHAIALGVGAIVVAGAAAVFPRFVFWILLASVVAVALSNSDVIANYIDKGSAKLRDATASA